MLLEALGLDTCEGVDVVQLDHYPSAAAKPAASSALRSSLSFLVERLTYGVFGISSNADSILSRSILPSLTSSSIFAPSTLTLMTSLYILVGRILRNFSGFQ